MIRRLMLVGCIVPLIAIASVTTHGLTGEIENNKPVEEGYLPAPSVKAINAHRRVYGIAGDFGSVYYFTGNTDDLNAFLKTLGAEEKSLLNVTLTPEKGVAGRWHQKGTVTYSWSLSVTNYRDNVFIVPNPGETERQHEARAKEERAKLPKLSFDVVVPIGGSINLSNLKLPLVFEAGVGGDIQRFVRHHNNRRENARVSGKSLIDAPPTIEADTTATTLFGPADEEEPKKKDGE